MTPGHTRDHISVIVEDGDRAFFLGGDSSYEQANMLAGVIDGVSVDEKRTLQSLRLVRAFCAATPTVYLPTHDDDAGRRLQRREPAPV